ncbi:MAG: hypothetical protein MUE85_22285 [Microscillaceae bacterium]|jgi:uncharacterized membrane protein YfcA|nr:hypothetical protein [Microscillaceae bacterium]
MKKAIQFSSHYLGKILVAVGIVLAMVLGQAFFTTANTQFGVRLFGFILALLGFWLIVNQKIKNQDYQKVQSIFLNILVGAMLATGFVALLFIYRQ